MMACVNVIVDKKPLIKHVIIIEHFISNHFIVIRFLDGIMHQNQVKMHFIFLKYIFC